LLSVLRPRNHFGPAASAAFSRWLGLVPPLVGDTKLSRLRKRTLKQLAHVLLRSGNCPNRCFVAWGLKQAGNLARRNPLASSPYPKAFSVSTSRTLRPERCGGYPLPPPSCRQSIKIPNLNPKCKRNFSGHPACGLHARSHAQLANQVYSWPPAARPFLPELD